METTSELLSTFGVIDVNDLPDQRGVRSVPFEPHLFLADGANYGRKQHLVANLAQIWLRSYKRLPGAKLRQQFAACVDLILLNLVRAQIRSDGLAVGIGSSKQRLDASRRYHPDFMSVDYFLKARDLLLDQDIMTIAAPGYQNDGLAQVARYRLTDAARDQLLPSAPPFEAFRVSDNRETIILKDTKGHLAWYKDDTEKVAMRDALARINKTIAEACIGSTRPMIPELDLEEGHTSKNIRLYRIFNNGTFMQGGRFYGGWWQYAKRQFRPSITINEEATIEADFRGLHPSLLFAKNGLEIPEDPYSVVPGVLGDATLRAHAKTTFMALLNAGTGGTKEPRNFERSKFGISAKHFRAQVRDAFPMLPNVFNSGIGLHLQREDSDMAERIMLHFSDQGIPILPIHDSFIVAQHHRDELVQVMEEIFKRFHGFDIGVSVKGE